MKQTEEMKQAAFVELMHENGFQYLGATAREGQFIYERTWRHTVQVAFYGEQEKTYRIAAYISFGVPIVQLFADGKHIDTRDYFSPMRAMNAIKEIIRCAGYAM